MSPISYPITPVHDSNETALLERSSSPAQALPIFLNDARSIHKQPTFKQSLRAIFRSTYLNLLLPIVPIFFYIFATSPATIKHIVDVKFALGLISFIPLSRSLAFSADQIALRMPRGVGRLFRCFMGNSIEGAIAIISVHFCQIKLATAMLIGTILANTLLVLGAATACSGLFHSSSNIHLPSALSLSSALILSVFAILIPAAFDVGFSSDISIEKGAQDVLRMSRGISGILFVLYGVVVFTLYTHEHFSYDTVSAGGETSVNRSLRPTPRRSCSALDMEVEKGSSTDLTSGQLGEEEEELPAMNLWVSIFSICFFAFALLVVVFFTVQLIAEFISEHPAFNEEYLGLIIFPLVLNLSEQLPALKEAAAGKLDEVMAIAMGKSVQIALFYVPLVVGIAAAMGRPVSLLFNTFENIVLFLAVIIVSIILQKGKTNCLDGLLLLTMYAIIALAFWFYPHGGVGGSQIEHALQCSVDQVAWLVQRYGLEAAVEKAAYAAKAGGDAH